MKNVRAVGVTWANRAAKGVHRDDQQNYWHQASPIVFHMSGVQVPSP